MHYLLAIPTSLSTHSSLSPREMKREKCRQSCTCTTRLCGGLVSRRSHLLAVLDRVGAVFLEPFLGDPLDGLLAVVDVLGLLEDALPALELGEGDALALAVGDEVLAGPGEEQVGLAGGAEVADAVAGVEERRAVLVARHLGDGVGVGPDGQRLVVAEARVVVELDGPAVAPVEGVPRGAELGLVGDDLDVPHQLLAEQVPQEGLDDGDHAGAEHDDGHVVGARPHHKVLEVRVEGDVVRQDLQNLRERHLPRVEHLLERVAERVGVVDDGVEELAALRLTHAIIVGDVVVGVLESDGAVKVGEEDDPRLRVECLRERHCY